ncbi:hypothetical protein Cni_G14162 [Canna indica]|uniref:Arp2/3 complex 41 kDa subunit n=1 Tax=Canna indica TaxID=4628 RepID=A0AAQ3KAX1_9LILI|nr:hypothetical protein Cni_G14162 [Canna indica]
MERGWRQEWWIQVDSKGDGFGIQTWPEAFRYPNPDLEKKVKQLELRRGGGEGDIAHGGGGNPSVRAVHHLPCLEPGSIQLNRAALCVQWSPKENKFAVGSGAKIVCICYYEQENNWWVSKLIRKKHNSSVTSVAWHPKNILLATTSTDGKCRVFSTFIKGVDSRESGSSSSSDLKFGEQIAQLDLSYTWSFGVRWSPSGNTLAYAGHNSMIYFIDDVGSSPSAQSVALRDLPLRDILFVSEKMVIGVGFDCNPIIFTADQTGLWSFLKFLDERKTAPSSSKYGSQFSEAFGKLYGQSKPGTNSDTVESSRARGGAHENCISCIVPLRKPGDPVVRRFSTSG